MTQAAYDWTWNGTSTGNKLIKAGPGVLVNVQINSTGTAGSTFTLYDATSSASVTPTIATIGTDQRLTYWYEVNFVTGLWWGHTSSTGDYTIVWD